MKRGVIASFRGGLGAAQQGGRPEVRRHVSLGRGVVPRLPTPPVQVCGEPSRCYFLGSCCLIVLLILCLASH